MPYMDGLELCSNIRQRFPATKLLLFTGFDDFEYTKEGFDIESHRRLARLYDELTERGCYCMLTNHNTELINDLYGNKGCLLYTSRCV